MNAPANLSLNDQIRARDGDKCWLCGGKLDFKAEPNSSKAPTREHLLAQSLGGSNDLANLVLCHPGCNRQLGTRPVEEKQRMRAKRRADQAKLAASQQAKKLAAKPAPTQPTPAPQIRTPPPAASIVHPSATTIRGTVARYDVARWQLVAAACACLACLFLGFSIGLLVD